MVKTYIYKKLVLVSLFLSFFFVSFAATVTYTISAKNTLATTGTAPSGSSASIVETYSTTKQMTASNSQTLTLSGYNGYKITSITLSMKSNTSAGAGSLIYKIDGGSDVSIITANNFNTASWNGAWSTAYVDVIKSVDITCGSTSTILKVAATVNSLYCQSYSLTYEATSTCTASNLAFAQANISKLVTDGKFTQTATSLNATTGITYASSNQTVATVDQSTGEVTPLTAGSTTITATQAAGTHSAVDYCAATATYTVDVATTAPTITVTEVIVPAMTAYAGASDTENIQVSGVNLTSNITLAITGANADLFTLSTNTVTLPTTVIVYYNPTTPGTHTATLTLSSTGATDVVRTLNGSSTWAPLQTPVATTASNISNTGFTANWDAVVGATEYTLAVTQTSGSAANATDLFISEYGEGSGGNKKYIEIYNGTGNTVDLSNYTIKKAVNGAGWNITIYSFPTLTTLTNNATFVLANNSTDVTGATVYDTFCTWNGDDAIGLFKNNILIDVFGNPDADPGSGWAVAGITDATVDHVLIRKASIISPITNWISSSGTTTENSEWIVSDFSYSTTDQTTNLGAHTFTSTGFSETPIAGSPFTLVGENTKTLTGLEAAKTYKYNVIAKNTNVSSSVSNTISVTTSPNTGIDGLTKTDFAYVSKGDIIVNTTIGAEIVVYNALGQLLTSRVAGNETTVISIKEKGVVIVKSGAKVVKLIL